MSSSKYEGKEAMGRGSMGLGGEEGEAKMDSSIGRSINAMELLKTSKDKEAVGFVVDMTVNSKSGLMRDGSPMLSELTCKIEAQGGYKSLSGVIGEASVVKALEGDNEDQLVKIKGMPTLAGDVYNRNNSERNSCSLKTTCWERNI